MSSTVIVERFPPQGLFGGRPGALCRIDVNDTPIRPTSLPELAFQATEAARRDYGWERPTGEDREACA